MRKARAVLVVVGPETFVVHLTDGREASIAWAAFPRLRDATPEQRKVVKLTGDGAGLRWPEVDEDISVEGLLDGTAGR